MAPQVLVWQGSQSQYGLLGCKTQLRFIKLQMFYKFDTFLYLQTNMIDQSPKFQQQQQEAHGP